jgi:CheY-like chemotaxis protein
MPMHCRLILVVEDMPIIRMDAADALTDGGFEVIEAHDAATAFKFLQSSGADVRLLFTDIHMPGSMNGLELAHQSFHHWPWIALLVTSGDALPAPSEMPYGGRFLPKPYAIDHMLAHVREMTLV